MNNNICLSFDDVPLDTVILPLDELELVDTERKDNEADLEVHGYYHNKQSIVDWKKSEPKSFFITDKAMTYEWEGYGLKVYVPAKCLPQYLESARLDIKLSIFKNKNRGIPGQWQYMYPVSLLYCMNVGKGELQKPVMLEIQHCALIETVDDSNKLGLLCAGECDNFEQVHGAMFETNRDYGKVTVNLRQHYQWFIIGADYDLFQTNVSYKAQVYISRNIDRRMDFIVTTTIDHCIQAVMGEFPSDTYDLAASFPVTINSISIDFDIPEDGMHLENGWKVTMFKDYVHFFGVSVSYVVYNFELLSTSYSISGGV